MNKEPIKIITGATLVKPKGQTRQETVVLQGDRILDVSEAPPASLLLNKENVDVFSGQGCFLTPGLIEQHFHGGFGCDFNHSTITEIHELMEKLPALGITGVLPTLMSAPHVDMVTAGNTLEAAIHLNKPGQTRMLGIHLEGPFLNPKFRGAHPASDLLPGNLEALEALISPNVKLVTLAPELDPDGVMIQFLTRKGVRVSAGHSGASYEEMQQAIQHGLCCVTHLFNAMRPFHHREPGIVGAGLNEESLYVELIGDGVHLHPQAIRTILRTKRPEQLLLVSDCLALAGLSEGSTIQFGNQPVTLQGGQATNAEGNLAGSSVFLNQCLKNLVQWKLLRFADAVQVASANQAKFLGLDHELGKVEPGYLADLVLWNAETLEVEATWIGGEQVYSRGACQAASLPA